MKRSLYTRFLLCYILIGILSFFTVSTVGSYLVEKHLENFFGDALYAEAQTIAKSNPLKEAAASGSYETVRDSLSSSAVFRSAEIWILSEDGAVLFYTPDTASGKTPAAVKDFSPSVWADEPWAITTFYDYFPGSCISAVVPIDSTSVHNYVAIHYPLRNLYQSRSTIQEVILTIFVIVYAITFLLLITYHFRVHKPLQKIVKGASEYANGNLFYTIPVDTDDEMGYLANSLNYMADRLNENGEYQRRIIANVSHDFRSPLTSIKGYVEAMLDGTVPPELQGKYLKIIAFESERLEKLTKGLLTLNELDVKQRMLNLRRFDINEIITTAAASFERICSERDIMLELLLSGKGLFVRADMEQIQQVLYNLLDNAIKFSNAGSSIILETTERNGKVFVSVKDHGTGIPKENLSRIWERFYKLDLSRGKDRKGTGLGLSIVKEIINAHGQNINVISTEGVGTEFIFTLEKAK